MDRPIQEFLTFETPEAWRTWLEQHHATAQEVWLLHPKKGAAARLVGYEEAVEEALCFGWIDGRLRSIDEKSYALRYSPRKRRSIWAESNKRRVEKLIVEGRMTPAGLAKVTEAKENGEWYAGTAREDVDTIPPDLEQALKENEAAWDSFQLWSVSRKRQHLYSVTSAKRPETRQKRIRSIVDMAATAEKL
jgi:uncharacterized protein YdeI (YjbR/CyaY-like superfamily)